MKLPAFALLAAALAAPLLHAGPAEAAIVSAMRLSEAQNYGWLADVTDDARSYTIEGKTNLGDKEDLSVVTMPLLPALRRGPGRGATPGRGSDTQAQATVIYKGDEKFVLETPDGWKKSDELAAARSRYGRGPGGYGGYGGYGGRGGYWGRGPSRGGDRGSGPSRGYSNLQPTLSRPHEEIAIIVAGYTDLKPEPDGASGTLSETNAKLLLVHAGQKDIMPLRASGTFRLWLKDGELVKYEVKLEGKLAVQTRDGRREVDVHQTATTTLRDVNTTTFDVPEAARKKLGA